MKYFFISRACRDENFKSNAPYEFCKKRTIFGGNFKTSFDLSCCHSLFFVPAEVNSLSIGLHLNCNSSPGLKPGRLKDSPNMINEI